jgi:four helix bundle protein
MRLSRECYLLTDAFPARERYGVTSQIRRAAISVAANIAEGNGRFTSPDYIRHLSIANGSLREVETLLLFAHSMGWVDAARARPLLARSDDTGRMIVALARSLRTSETRT